MQKNFKIYYVCELNLPSKSAYSIHVMKMCEAFSKIGFDLNLLTINHCKNSNLFRLYNVKYQFKIDSIFKNKINFNLLLRILFTIKILLKRIEKDSIFISRSIIFALIASAFKKKVVLELHHEISGFSKLLYFLLAYFNLIQNLKYIFLHKNLNKIYKIKKKKNFLDDGVDINVFKFKKKIKYINTCIYIGSFFEGKGIETILKIAKLNKKITFHLYGDKNFLQKNKISKNVKIFDYISYNKIPKILSLYKVALMPYQNKVKGRNSSVWLENYMSPLKMFDYLAAKMIIIATDLKVYRHILKDGYNCKFAPVDDHYYWNKIIQDSFKNNLQNNKITINAYKTAKKYTWEIRCKKIIKFINT